MTKIIFLTVLIGLSMIPFIFMGYIIYMYISERIQFKKEFGISIKEYEKSDEKFFSELFEEYEED